MEENKIENDIPNSNNPTLKKKKSYTSILQIPFL